MSVLLLTYEISFDENFAISEFREVPTKALNSLYLETIYILEVIYL